MNYFYKKMFCYIAADVLLYPPQLPTGSGNGKEATATRVTPGWDNKRKQALSGRVQA